MIKRLLKMIRLGIFARMVLTIGVASLLPLAAVILITRWEASRIVFGESFRYGGELGSFYVNKISADLSSIVGEGRALRAFSENYRSMGADRRRNRIAESLKSVLARNEIISGVWTVWEPGAIEDNPDHFINSRLSFKNGAFYSIYYRNNGTIVPGILDRSFYRNDIYLGIKSRMKEFLFDPVWYSYPGSGKDLFLKATIAMPIIEDGKFKGVIGIDFSMDHFQKIIEQIKVFKTGYGVMVAGNGMRIAHPLKEKIGDIIGDDQTVENQRQILDNIIKGERFTFDKTALIGKAFSRLFFTPIQIGNTDSRWFFILLIPVQDITEKGDQLFFTISVIGVIAVLLLLAAIFYTARKFSHPILELARYSEKVAEGNLSTEIHLGGSHEIEQLAVSFNNMTGRLASAISKYNSTNIELLRKNDELHEAQNKLALLNNDLERQVEERTAELNDAVARLEKINENLNVYIEKLNSMQNQIILSEKMAVIGQLVANIAHELNTPLGAIRSAGNYMSKVYDELCSDLGSFYISLTAEERELFTLLQQKGRKNSKNFSVMEIREQKKELRKRLLEAGVDDLESVADDIISLGAVEDADRVLPFLLKGKTEFIAFASRIAAVQRSMEIILNASQKAAGTIGALSDYIRADQAEEMRLIEPAREIETILVLYYNKIKHGVTIDRKFECLDPIMGFRDKLNQVWVNLINNALQAIQYRGTLEIALRRRGELLAISFTDNGPGVASEIKDRIFEPFFTTREKGEGIGLGLDICKKIVDLHGGKIELESTPGRTVFTVLLKIAV